MCYTILVNTNIQICWPGMYRVLVIMRVWRILCMQCALVHIYSIYDSDLRCMRFESLATDRYLHV